jgi:mono/diheme cytochrome c family protein
MKVCAEYEEQIAAFTAHRALLDNGADPQDIEIRSPYPLSEHPIPPHRSKPMIMRNIVRVFWLLGLIGGFIFITFTQWEWGLTAKTSGQPLVAIPINAIIMYETGMITAIIVTTIMFFVETRRYRQLVPPIEEDMIVANGYIALVVAGESAKKAKEVLESTSARQVVSYILPLAFVSLFLSGCGTFIQTTRWDNIRQTQVIKPGERSADAAAPFSLRMPSVAEQEVKPPQPLGYLYYGNQAAFERGEADLKATEAEMTQQMKDGKIDRRTMNKALRTKRRALDDVKPEIVAKKNFPPAMRDVENPVTASQSSLEAGEKLYNTNCAMCHGATGMGDGGVGQFWGGPGVVPNLGDASKYGDESTYPDGFFYHNIAVGKNAMPAFGYKLNAKQTWDIVNYVRKLQGKV